MEKLIWQDEEGREVSRTVHSDKIDPIAPLI